MKKTFALLAVAAAALATSAHAATTVLVDFGNTGPSAVYTEGGISYNKADSKNTFANLTATDSSSTTWSVTVSGAGAGSGSQPDVWGGTSANAVSPFTNLSDTALKDGFYINNNNTLTIAFSGLDNSMMYNLAAFGAQTTDGVNTPSNFSLTVGTSASPGTQVLDLQANPTTGAAAQWGSVAPVGGNITLTVTANGAGGGGLRTELNAARLEAIPEPSAALLGAFGLLGLLRRRRG